MIDDAVLPCYLSYDESLSMVKHRTTVAGIIESFVSNLHRARQSTFPGVDVHLAMIGFSDDVRVLAPLAPLAVPRLLPPSRWQTSITSFRSVFTSLAGIIDHDVETLCATSREVRRPVVLFISDGQPTDPATWPAAYTTLVDPSRRAHPHLLTVGVGDADAATLGRIATFEPVGHDHGEIAVRGSTCSERCSLAIPAAEPSGSADQTVHTAQAGPAAVGIQL